MNKKIIKAHLALFSAGCMWGLMAPIGKLALNAGVSSLSLTAFRMGGAALCFWIASLFVEKEKVSPRELVLLFFASLLCIVFNQGAFIFGLSLTSPVEASLITTALPIITLILSAIILKDKITSLKIGGVLLGTTGAMILILNKETQSAQAGHLWGNLLCLLAQTSFATYLVVFKKLIQRHHIFTLMKWMFLYASLCFLPFSYEALVETFSRDIPMSAWFEIGYVIIFGTFLSYICIMIGQKALPPTVISMYNYVLPIVGTAVSIMIGMGTFGWIKACAALLIFTGVYIVTQGKFPGMRKQVNQIKP